MKFDVLGYIYLSLLCPSTKFEYFDKSSENIQTSEAILLKVAISNANNYEILFY